MSSVLGPHSDGADGFEPEDRALFKIGAICAYGCGQRLFERSTGCELVCAEPHTNAAGIQVRAQHLFTNRAFPESRLPNQKTERIGMVAWYQALHKFSIY